MSFLTHRTPIRERAVIAAPLDRCWALSTRIELVQKTLDMQPVAGVTQGFIHDGSRVTWKGWKFGLPTEHHTLITGFVPPHEQFEIAEHETYTRSAFFQDTQERGRFKLFVHDHWLYESEAYDGSPRTTLVDQVSFALPFWPLGELVARAVMVPYIRGLVHFRFRSLRTLAEGEGWRDWV